MASLQQSGGFAIEQGPLEAIRAEFDAFSVDEAETTREIARTWRESGYLVDPHTAVGLSAARLALARDPETPIVALGTAHPAKFPDAIEIAIGARPHLPNHLADLFDKEEHFSILPNDQREIERFIQARARRSSKRAAS
jgi:threonine synthase